MNKDLRIARAAVKLAVAGPGLAAVILILRELNRMAREKERGR